MNTIQNPATQPFYTRRFAMMPIFALCILVAAVLWRMNVSTPQEATMPTTPIELASSAAITQMENRIQQNPEDIQAYTLLGRGLLQRVRETGDTRLYERAGQVFTLALEKEPNNLEALIGQGMLAASLHDFSSAIEWAKKAQTINPWRAEILGILVDGYVELGRYDEAVTTTQEMVSLRPGLDSYARVSYMRELYGDLDGAITAMQDAVDAGVPETEAWRWATVQLGNLYFQQGDIDTAEQHLQIVLNDQPEYVLAILGMADISTARGDLDAAEAAIERLVARLPLAEFIIPLGDIYAANNKPALAAEQYDRAEAMLKASLAEDKVLDHEVAEFTLAHGDAHTALAQAQTVYDQGPTIFAAETLAMAFYQLGEFDKAWETIQEGLRLNTRDFHLHWYAGVIAHARGDLSKAETYLTEAVAINPIKSSPDVIEAKALLAEVHASSQ